MCSLKAADVKEYSFCLRGTPEERSNFFFSQGRFFFQACVASTSCQGFQEISALLGCMLFYLFDFPFFQITINVSFIFNFCKGNKKSKVGDLSRWDPKNPIFNSYHTEVLGKVLLHSLDCSTLPLILTRLSFINLSVKQGRIKYHFLNIWYDSTWDWNLVSRTIGKHSTH